MNFTIGGFQLYAMVRPENGTLVEFKTTYENVKDIHKLVEMGFEQGITMTFEYLATLFE